MPVSKRNRVVSLTQTKKKGLEHKQKVVTEIREALDKYDKIFIFSIENMRNNKLKEVRDEWKSTSKFIMGKNKVLQLALGRTAESEIADNIHKISERLIGQCGLLLTSQPEQEVIEYFDSYRQPDFARAGFVATEQVVLRENDLSDFPHSMEPQFRRLGLPTKLVNGKIKLLQDFTVCEEGDTLTPEMADILKHKGIEMAEFHVTLECVWRKEGGAFTILNEKEERSVAEIKKAKSKKSKSKRPRLAVIPSQDAAEESDDDDEEEEEEEEDGESGGEEMEVGEESEDEEEVEKKKQQKENRPIKKASRKSKTSTDQEPAPAGEKQKKTAVSKIKEDHVPRRITRSSVKTSK